MDRRRSRDHTSVAEITRVSRVSRNVARMSPEGHASVAECRVSVVQESRECHEDHGGVTMDHHQIYM